MKFKAYIEEKTLYCVTVEADTIEEAEEAAYDAFYNGKAKEVNVPRLMLHDTKDFNALPEEEKTIISSFSADAEVTGVIPQRS